MSGNIFEEFPGFAGDGEDRDDFAPEVRALCDSAEAWDTSWHNNACPSVTLMVDDCPRVVLWDSGTDPAVREVATARFMVHSCDAESAPLDDTWEGDDADAAVAQFRRRVATVQGERADVRFAATVCPECGAPAHAVMELCAVTTPLTPRGDGYDYAPEDRDFGDVFVDVNAAGAAFVVGACGHQWRSGFTEREEMSQTKTTPPTLTLGLDEVHLVEMLAEVASPPEEDADLCDRVDALLARIRALLGAEGGDR